MRLVFPFLWYSVSCELEDDALVFFGHLKARFPLGREAWILARATFEFAIFWGDGRHCGEMPEETRACRIETEYIELNKLLKRENIASSGGEAKLLTREGMVEVDGDVETRVRRKLRPGCVVRCRGETIRVAKG